MEEIEPRRSEKRVGFEKMSSPIPMTNKTNRQGTMINKKTQPL